jgi:hypothetical protein
MQGFPKLTNFVAVFPTDITDQRCQLKQVVKEAIAN